MNCDLPYLFVTVKFDEKVKFLNDATFSPLAIYSMGRD